MIKRCLATIFYHYASMIGITGMFDMHKSDADRLRLTWIFLQKKSFTENLSQIYIPVHALNSETPTSTLIIVHDYGLLFSFISHPIFGTGRLQQTKFERCSFQDNSTAGNFITCVLITYEAIFTLEDETKFTTCIQVGMNTCACFTTKFYT